MRRHLVCALALLAGGCARLEPGLDLPPPPAAFVAFDADGQQATLSRAEYEALGEAVFRELDVNGDGHLSQADFRRSFGELDRDGDGLIGLGEAPALVAAGDSDGDGRLSQEEFRRLEGILEKWDRNGDGRLSRAEWDYQMAARLERVDRNRNGYIGTLEAPRFTLFDL